MPGLFNDAFFSGMSSSALEVDRAQMLPPVCYTDPVFYEFEKDAIFAKERLCVERQEWVAKPGDYFTAMHLGEPIIIVRGRDDRVRAMSSVCQHRAMLVAEGRGNQKAFLSPYHHWVYGLDGQLLHAPAMERARDFDIASVSLPTFQSIWGQRSGGPARDGAAR